MSGGTSLARQLAALRTPGSVTAAASSVYSGPFLFPEAETDHSSIASLRETVCQSLAQLVSQDTTLASYSVLLQESSGGEEEDKETEQLVADCLHALSAHLLLRPAQWVLQWLVTRYRVHIRQPRVLLFSLLPHHSYKIYQAVLDTLDMDSLSHKAELSWLSTFKTECCPTSQIALHRHTASSLGFVTFLCEDMLGLVDHLQRHPTTRPHKQATFVLTTLLGGLQSCTEVGEVRLHPLLQLVLKGFKCSNSEISSLSSVLLAYLLPRVVLKAKTVTKLAKSVTKYAKSVGWSEDSLFLSLLLARTQSPCSGVLELVVAHESVVNSLVSSEDDSIDTLDGLVYSLTVLLEQSLPIQGQNKLTVSQQEIDLTSLLITCSEVNTLTDLTVARLVSMTGSIVKKIHKDNIATNPQLRTIKDNLEKIMSNIKQMWPSLYLGHVAPDTKSDIMFITGVETPSDIQMETMKVLQSNQMVSHLSKNHLVSIADKNSITKIVKKNEADISTILKADTSLLLNHLGLKNLDFLLINLFRISGHNTELQQKIVDHLTTSTLSPVTELFLISKLLTTCPKVTTSILQTTVHQSDILSLLSSLSPTTATFPTSLSDKLSLILGPDNITTIATTPALLNSPPVATLVLFLLPSLIQTNPSIWYSTLTDYVIKLIESVKFSYATEKVDFVTLVKTSDDNNSVSWNLLLDCVRILVKNEDCVRRLMLIMPTVIEKKGVDKNEELKEIIRTEMNEEYLSFFLLLAHQSQDEKLIYLSLLEGQTVINNNLTKKQQDDILLLIVIFSLHEKTRIRRTALSVLEKLINTKTSLSTLVTFLTNNKAEMVDNLDNLAILLEKEPLEVKTAHRLLELSLVSRIDNIFTKLHFFFLKLTESEDAQLIFKHGCSLLKKDEINEEFNIIVDNFLGNIVSNINNETCWDFLENCLRSEKTIKVSGVPTLVSNYILSNMARVSDLQNIPDEMTNKLFSLLTRVTSSSTSSVLARQLAILLHPSLETVLTEFKRIWGEGAFSGAGRVTGRGKFSLMYGTGTGGEEEDGKWVETCWLLETTDKMVESGDWKPLIRPLFILLRKASDIELENGTYKVSLLLSVLLNIFTVMSDKQLMGLEPGLLEPELLVHIIRSSPSPDTRHTALQVLARCAVSNPDFILHNSITIFTFMGSHLLKVDSRRSFQVACEALQVIVPAIKSACETPGRSNQLVSTCHSVLTTFIDASQDIPTHRLAEFLVRLITCLGEKEYLWVAALLLIRKDKSGGERKVVELFCQFSPSVCLEAILRLLVNTRTDAPHLRKMFGVRMERKGDEDKPDDWDVLRLKALLGATTLLSSPSMVSHVSSALAEEDMAQMIHLLVEAAILTVQDYETVKVKMPVKFKKHLVAQSERVLEHSLSLLPPDLFLNLVSGLLVSEVVSVRHRALEVVNSKLTTPCPLPLESLPSLVSPLVKLSQSEEQAHTQQMALLAVRQIAKLLPDTEHLQEAADAFTCSFLDEITNPKVLGAAVISVGDILVSLGPLAVTRVSTLVNWLSSSLENNKPSSWTAKDVTVVHNSCLYSLQRMVETFIGFLHPLSGRLVVLGCKLSISPSSGPRAKQFLSSLATNLSTHVLLSQALNLLDKLLDSPLALASFVNLVAENCRQLERGRLSAVSKQFVALFTAALEFRAKHSGSCVDVHVVDNIEDSIISAFLSVTLRLSLEEFKPVYLRLLNLHQDTGNEKQLITIFNLTASVGTKLKSLFRFGLEPTVQLVSDSLKVERSSELVEKSLSALTALLTYNTGVPLELYETLVNTLMAVWLLPSPFLPNCLIRLAASTQDDTAWKMLHYQLLLALRDQRSEVRISILSVMCECVTDRTDTYLPVLPDAVPFLQEILEDDDQSVENKCREFIQHMETIFGQSLETYFV